MTIQVPATKEALAAEYVSLITHVSLHDGDPGETGANEVTGGTPAYARRAVTWTAGAVDGVYSGAVASAFDVPAGTDVTHVGFWSASSGGSFRDSAAHVASFPSQGTLSIDTLTYTQG